MTTSKTFHSLLLIAAVVLAMGQSGAAAQTMFHPDSKSPLKPNPYLKHQNPWRWDIRSQVYLRAGYVRQQHGRYNSQISGHWEIDIQNFEYIYPVVRQGGFYWSPNEDVNASLRIDNAAYTPEPQILRTPDSHTPYVWWKSNPRDVHTKQLHFTQYSHIVSADTVFNEELAKEIPWPDAWPEEAARFQTPVIDRIQDPIDIAGQDQLTHLVDQWTEGKDPKSVNQLTLVKYLTGKVIEHVHVSKPNTHYSPVVHDSTLGIIADGFASFPMSSWTGFWVRSADQVALEPSGSELDLSTMLTAVLRAAGVPARTVVCYDNGNSVDQSERILAIVEFAMYDKPRDQILWIPIDLQLLIDNGRRSNVYKQRWDYFGNHDGLHDIVPLAYYFHPPVNYKAYAYPGLYGFRATPDIGDRVYQIISIDVMNTPIKGGELRP